jgi:hypothetical protein
MDKSRYPTGRPAGPSAGMPNVPAVKPPPPPRVVVATTPPTRELPSRPRVLDFLCIAVGVMLSRLLSDMAGLHATTSGPQIQAGQLQGLLVPALPFALFLPVGVVLFWPIFYVNQWILGRRQGMSSAEWLLGLSWLVFSALTVWILLKGTGHLPEMLAGANVRKYVVAGYMLYMIAMAALALLLFLFDVCAGWTQPWTQALTIALMLWPMLPLACLWGMGLKLEFMAPLPVEILP